DLDPGVTERVRHDLGTAIVAVETGLRDQDPERTVGHRGETSGVKAGRKRGCPCGSSATRTGASRTRAPTASAPGSGTSTSGANTRCPATSTIASTSGLRKPAGTPVSWTVKPWIRPADGRSTHSKASEVHAGQKPRGGQSVRPQPRQRVVVKRPSARWA